MAYPQSVGSRRRPGRKEPNGTRPRPTGMVRPLRACAEGAAVPWRMAVDRRGLSPVMVGRSAELDRLVGLIPSDQDKAGAPRVALIAGEAGIGKSRLVAEVRAASPRGTAILVGRAGNGPPRRPYSLLLDAVEPVVTSWSEVPRALTDREDAVRVLLYPVAPAIGAPPVRDYGPDEVLRAAVDVVRHIASRPGVVVFEDLHDADAESVGLFARLALVDDLGIALIGTHRPD